MAYNEGLAERLRGAVARKRGVTEKKMFGGLSFLLHGKMFCGVLKDDLVVRVNPDESDTFLKEKHVRPMDFTGRPMKGYLYISAGGYATDQSLQDWVNRSLDFVATLPKKKAKARVKTKS